MATSPIQRVTITGVGVMGAAIAQVLALHGCAVRLHDVSDERLAWARERIRGHRYGLDRAVELGKLPADERDAALARISGTTDLARACEDAELVVEAVPEDLALKVEVFRRLDSCAPANAILASNTSGLPIAALAGATERPERVLGWHWFQPAPVMKLVEVVTHPRADPAAREALVALAERCGKTPQVVNDQPFAWGFVGNRIFAAARREARAIVAEGVATPEQVDAIMRDGFRWPMLPFEGLGGIPK
jgi:3-hydroxyacyl-CoA dehydrogenase